MLKLLDGRKTYAPWVREKEKLKMAMEIVSALIDSENGAQDEA